MKSEKSPGQKDGTHNECFGAFHFWAIRIGKDFTWTLQYVFKKLVIFKVTTDPSLQLQHNIDMILNCYSRILLVTEQIRWSQVLEKRCINCPTPSPLKKKRSLFFQVLNYQYFSNMFQLCISFVGTIFFNRPWFIKLRTRRLRKPSTSKPRYFLW